MPKATKPSKSKPTISNPKPGTIRKTTAIAPSWLRDLPMSKRAEIAERCLELDQPGKEKDLFDYFVGLECFPLEPNTTTLKNWKMEFFGGEEGVDENENENEVKEEKKDEAIAMAIDTEVDGKGTGKLEDGTEIKKSGKKEIVYPSYRDYEIYNGLMNIYDHVCRSKEDKGWIKYLPLNTHHFGTQEEQNLFKQLLEIINEKIYAGWRINSGPALMKAWDEKYPDTRNFSIDAAMWYKLKI